MIAAIAIGLNGNPVMNATRLLGVLPLVGGRTG
jgi:hypothetical protein